MYVYVEMGGIITCVCRDGRYVFMYVCICVHVCITLYMYVLTLYMYRDTCILFSGW